MPLPALLVVAALLLAVQPGSVRCQSPPLSSPPSLVTSDEELMLGLWEAEKAWQNATASAGCSSVPGVPWTLGSPLCNSTAGPGWRGITCDDRGYITSIRLEGCGLTGPLPEELAQLPYLALLDLTGNELTGAVPEAWTAPGAFPALDSLNLSRNALSGELEDLTMAAQGCVAGRALNVSRSGLGGGPIPDSWYSRSLASMDLSFNGIGGELPAAWGLPRTGAGLNFSSAFPALQLLAVQGNNLSGPADPWPGGGAAAFAPGFREITQPGNPLLTYGAAPPALAPAAPRPGGGGVEAALLAQRIAITNWDEFAASNDVTGWAAGTDPCGWTGVFCSNATVTTLDWGCLATQPTPSPVSFCGVRAQGTLAGQLATISSLQNLYFTAQNLSGSLPAKWSSRGAFPSLQVLDACFNSQLSGPLPDGWGQPGSLPQLRTLSLCNTSLSGSLPSSWADPQAMASLSDLILANCRLQGPLPPAWANFTSLRLLSLDKNRLTGGLPEAWAGSEAFPNLQQLSLDTNALNGTLPDAWGAANSLPALAQLWLYSNNFTGTLPAAWSGGFGALQILDLHGQRLQGALPPAWGSTPNSLASLEELWLNTNNLTGSIPAAWGEAGAFESLSKLGLDDNPLLCGPVPDRLVQPVCLTSATVCTPDNDLACGTPPPGGAGDAAGDGDVGSDALAPSPAVVDDSLTAGTVAGIVVAAVAGGAMAVLSVLFVRKRRKRARRRAAAAAASGGVSGGKGLDEGGLGELKLEPAGASGPRLSPGSALGNGSAAASPAGSLAAPGSGPPAPRPGRSVRAAGLAGDPLLTFIDGQLASMHSVRLDASRSAALPAPAAAAAAAAAGAGAGEAALASRGSGASEPQGAPDMAMWLLGWEELALERLIGRGSFGFVYLARWRETPVAAKVLLASEDFVEGGLELPQATMRSLQEEAAMMAGIRHPNIVSFMGLCTLPPCIVTEWCSRGSLYDVLRRAARDERLAAQLTWQQTLRMALDAATGLLYLHARSPQIVHRDVKSPNLLVDSAWRVKVADFNLSKILGSEAPSLSTSGAAGNPLWLAPEVLEGERATAASDVYAFGLVLLELLTWELPWRLPPFAVMRAVAGGGRPPVPAAAELRVPDPPPAAELEAYCALMRQCWAQDPAQRPPFAAVVPALRALLDRDGLAPGASLTSPFSSGWPSAALSGGAPAGWAGCGGAPAGWAGCGGAPAGPAP